VIGPGCQRRLEAHRGRRAGRNRGLAGEDPRRPRRDRELLLSPFLFTIGILTYLIYDRRNRMISSRVQLRIRDAIGSGERVFDRCGIAVETQRDDVFRHGLLDFRSGDRTVKASGTSSRQFKVPNVVSVNRKLELIQKMLRERQVVLGLGLFDPRPVVD
jgi:hypothetical protein